jgi:integrase
MKPYRVYVLRFRDCRNLVLRYQDPVTGKYERSTTYTDPQTGEVFTTGENRKQAKKLAALWEADLNAGRAQSRYDTGWAEFRDRYENEVVPSLAERTAGKITTTLNAVERILPRVANGKLADLTPEALSRFQAALRDGRRSENTIKGYLNHLRAALSWAVAQEMIFKMPAIKKVQRAKKGGVGHKGKGRAITTEEFERLLAAVPATLGEWRKLKRHAARKTARNKGLKQHKTKTDSIPVEISPKAVASWRHYLTGLWLSGLRLTESLEVYWDRPDDRLCIDLEGKHPRLRIPAELEKGHRDRLLPITPDFAEYLLLTPGPERRGPIFRPLMPSESRANAHLAGRMISLIGEKAHVVVHTDARTGHVKYASAHDLRRSFGTRWAKQVKTPILMRLMRHENIQTTMSYYVSLECDEIAEQLWGVGSVFGSVAASGPETAGGQTTQPFAIQRVMK